MESEKSGEAFQVQNFEKTHQRDGSQYDMNQSRMNPYKHFQFRVKWHGKYVAGFCEMLGLKLTTEVGDYREEKFILQIYSVSGKRLNHDNYRRISETTEKYQILRHSWRLSHRIPILNR